MYDIMKNVQIVHCAFIPCKMKCIVSSSACTSGSDIRGKHIYIRISEYVYDAGTEQIQVQFFVLPFGKYIFFGFIATAIVA